MHIRGEKDTYFKPRYTAKELYPEQTIPPIKPASGSIEELIPLEEPEFKKNMNEIVANAYRPGYSVRTFANTTVMNHRTDNVGRLVENVNYRTESQGVDYNINFNINSIDLVSRLNSHFHEVMGKRGK